MKFRGRTDVRSWLILSGIRDGKTNGQIAEQIGLLPNSVRTYIAALYSYYGANSRAALVVAAIEAGTIQPYSPQKKTRSA